MRSSFTLGIVAVALCHACAGGEVKPAESPKPQDLALGDDYRYVENPDVKWKREYWVLLQSKETGRFAMYPRPDGNPLIQEACASDGKLRERFEANALCSSAGSEAAVNRINSLSREDARFVSTWLHERLVFRRDGEGITPSPLTSDILAACAAASVEERKGVFAKRCDFEEKGAAGTRPSIFLQFTEAELDAWPTALNRLYGIAES